METLAKYATLEDQFKHWLGTPYVWGGNSEKGIDCSGLVQKLLASINLDPPGDQTAQGLYNFFVGNEGTIEDVLGCGSLVFYGKSKDHITHVAMMTDPYQIIEAGGGGHTCTTVEIAKSIKACVRINDMDYRKDLVAVLRPDFG